MGANKKGLIIEGLLFAVWCVFLIVLADFSVATAYFWVEGAFVVVAFGIVAYTLLTKANTNASTVETGASTYVFAFIYLAVTLVSNSAWMIFLIARKSKLLILWDCIVLVVYVAILIASNSNTKRVNALTEHATEKTSSIKRFSSKIGVLISLATEENVKEELLDLKKSVDYSSNISKENAYQVEASFEEILDQLNNLMSGDQNLDVVFALIQEAKKIWKTRNSL